MYTSLFLCLPGAIRAAFAWRWQTLYSRYYDLLSQMPEILWILYVIEKKGQYKFLWKN